MSLISFIGRSLAQRARGGPRPKLTVADVPALMSELLPMRSRPPVDPKRLGVRSPKKVWWRCRAGPDHVWLARVDSRGAYAQLPASLSVTGRSDSAENSSQGAADGHMCAHKKDTPDDDDGPGDVPAAAAPQRQQRRKRPVVPATDPAFKPKGCPFCAGRRPSVTNRLDIVCPDVAAEWHPTRNKGVRPSQVTAASHHVAWWLCSRGHAFQARVDSRTEWARPAPRYSAPSERSRRKRRGCPVCANKIALGGVNTLESLAPHVAAEWDEARNGAPADSVVPGSNSQAWWRCGKGHSWKAQIVRRVAGELRCPVCFPRKRMPAKEK